jgi:hypothetical protein
LKPQALGSVVLEPRLSRIRLRLNSFEPRLGRFRLRLKVFEPVDNIRVSKSIDNIESLCNALNKLKI